MSKIGKVTFPKEFFNKIMVKVENMNTFTFLKQNLSSRELARTSTSKLATLMGPLFCSMHGLYLLLVLLGDDFSEIRWHRAGYDRIADSFPHLLFPN